MIKENIFENFDFDMNNYFTLNQMMKEFGVTETTIWRWRKSKGLKTMKFGSKHVFHKKDVFEFFNRENS